MRLNWFASKTVKQAIAMQKHVKKLFASQRDILSPAAVAAIAAAIGELDQAIDARAGDGIVQGRMTNLESVATKWIKPYPHAGLRENVEVLLVALAVAMGIRTFFAQPFKIPTGSMQPSLFGVTFKTIDPEKIPGAFARTVDFWLRGNSYYNIVAPEDGQLQSIRPPQKLLMFNLKQEYEFNDKWYTVWFPADDLFVMAGRLGRNGYGIDSSFLKAGEPIARLKITAGDHLFVDRMSYNFRHPNRGEIIVFETRGIGNEHAQLPPDQFYIKRMVAMGNEKVELGDDRHLIIDGHRLDKTTPHFENVYSFSPDQPAQVDQFSGHVFNQNLAPLFADFPDRTFTVRPDHYMVMGDNTLNSFDSRAWGDFSRTNVIGKYLFVYWPFSSRFGWNVR